MPHYPYRTAQNRNQLGYAFLLLIVVAFLFFGLRWTSHELAFLVLLVTICEVSLVPGFHLTTTQLASTLEQGLLLALRESIVWLFVLFLVYVQYATHTSTLVMRLLACLVPSRQLLSLLHVFGIGPCLASRGGPIAETILLLPLLTCLHQNRTNVIEPHASQAHRLHRRSLPGVGTFGCFWCTLLLMDQSGMVKHSLEMMHLDASWLAALLGAVEG